MNNYIKLNNHLKYYKSNLFYLEVGGSRFLWNTDEFLHDCMVSHPRRW